ncbi:hypothetical protein Tco_0466937, partial [Tanacetum coccineum]
VVYVAAGSYPFCWTIGFCWLYSVSAGSYGFCCCFRVHDGGHTSAGGFIYLLIGCMFLLCAWFLLLDDSFCWCNNVTAA